MDPLSLSASVAGLMGAVGQICSILDFLSTAWNCPSTIQDCRQEITHVKIALRSLQRYVVRFGTMDPQRLRLIQIDDLIITLSDAMMSFSASEDVVRPLEKMCRAHAVVSWVRYYKDIDGHLCKIQRHKASLMMMLNILQCESDIEALEIQERLQNRMEEVLNDNRELKRKLRELEDHFDARSIFTCGPPGSAIMRHQDQDDDVSTIRGKGKDKARSAMIRSLPLASEMRFAFEEVLEKSWVYRRNAGNECDNSFVSSHVLSHAWPVFSGLSLAEISVVSVIAMPLTPLDL
ncbi:hypothetical protein QBC46DRAFT_215044, partial [Diplogelasinospora grovesii]